MHGSDLHIQLSLHGRVPALFEYGISFIVISVPSPAAQPRVSVARIYYIRPPPLNSVTHARGDIFVDFRFFTCRISENNRGFRGAQGSGEKVRAALRRTEVSEFGFSISVPLRTSELGSFERNRGVK